MSHNSATGKEDQLNMPQLYYDEIRQSVDNGKMVVALFLDLSKAFDTMNHGLILSKQSDFGVAPLEREWFAEYLLGSCLLYTSPSPRDRG